MIGTEKIPEVTPLKLSTPAGIRSCSTRLIFTPDDNHTESVYRERAGVHALTRCRSIRWSGRIEVLESLSRVTAPTPPSRMRHPFLRLLGIWHSITCATSLKFLTQTSVCELSRHFKFTLFGLLDRIAPGWAADPDHGICTGGAAFAVGLKPPGGHAAHTAEAARNPSHRAGRSRSGAGRRSTTTAHWLNTCRRSSRGVARRADAAKLRLSRGDSESHSRQPELRCVLDILACVNAGDSGRHRYAVLPWVPASSAPATRGWSDKVSTGLTSRQSGGRSANYVVGQGHFSRAAAALRAAGLRMPYTSTLKGGALGKCSVAATRLRPRRSPSSSSASWPATPRRRPSRPPRRPARSARPAKTPSARPGRSGRAR
ncbi:hypothetical protein QFZ49_006667 [Streptomyces turgidiscabies]|uniref:Transposase n=1 Tax=Streptomyces turgidiscabies TaxID=85558 RepID=A0ABU0RZW0_9ACTN|nr:hypothetical protein [Streptomyces turgidiscabies]